mmetsp:Transcript_44906/g.104942  ORF Transcript_44906/g.104942 Transcript_44906/m.104942 type:complete len:255 (+) Transcript_44906:710-1474(+)
MKIPYPSSLRRRSCSGVPSRAAQPSVKHRKFVNMASGTYSNSSYFEKRVLVTTPSRYMQRSSNTTAQNNTRSPVKTPWIISLSSVKILNFSNRMMRPRRASFNIFRLDATLASPLPSPVVVTGASGAHGVAFAGTAVVVVNWTSVSAEIVKARSTRARATQRMSNQDQYQSGPKRYSRGLNILSFTMISAMKKMVKQISSTCHIGLSGSMSALMPATAAFTKMTQAGMISNSSRKVELSSTLASCRRAFPPRGV